MRLVVIDTNVLISALKSRRGAPFALLREIGNTWSRLISVSLLLEYEALAKRESSRLGIPLSTINEIIAAFPWSRPLRTSGRDTTRVFGDNKKGRIMAKNIAVTEDLYERAAKAAASDQVSVDEFACSILSQQLASREYVESRARLFDRDAFEKALQTIPDLDPEEKDIL